MYVHRPWLTWLAVALVVGTAGLWIPIVVLLRQVDKYRIRRAGGRPALCDCCGSYYPEAELTAFSGERGERIGLVCERAVDQPRDIVRDAVETPMLFKYLH